MFNRKYREHFQNLIIASTGRSGSTYLYNNISYNFCKQYSFLPLKFNNPHFEEFSRGEVNFFDQSKLNFVEKRIFSLSMQWSHHVNNSNIKKMKPIIKTHDFYKIDDKKIKYIFIFRNPLSILTSIMYKVDNNENNFITRHLNHLSSNNTIDHILNEDVLNYKLVSESFIKHRKTGNILFLNFSDLSKSSKVLSEYIGLNINLPKLEDKELHPRIKDLDNNLSESLLSTYKELISCAAL